MQAMQTRLPRRQTPAKSRTMSKDLDHTELCQWLKAVAESRDKHAFTCLFKFFAPKIQRIARSKFSNEAQVNEVVQETMSNVWSKSHYFDETKGAATTWVYTIMRNVSFDMLRKMKSNREDNLSEDIWPVVESAQSQDETFADHLENDQIKEVIKELPENQQQVIKGFYFNEMSQEQLAKHLNVPIGTIKSRLRLALAKLKLKLGENHD